LSEDKKEIVSIDIDMKDIESQSQIYNTSQIDSGHKMYQYFQEMNKASLKLAVDNPQLLKDKHKLQQLAREYVHANGYAYKKKTSRSKQFGVSGENKRPYSTEAFKLKKIKEIQEDMSDADTQMALLTRQREKNINVKQFGQAATITDQISQLRAKKRQLENELTLIQSRKKQCARQKAKTGKEDHSKRVQGPKITTLLKTMQPSSTTTNPTAVNVDHPKPQEKDAASSEITTAESKDIEADHFLC